MKYISIQDLLDYGKELRFQSEEQMKAVYDRMPATEIVRCKDCKLWDKDTLVHQSNDFREWDEAECMVLAERDGYHEINRNTEESDFCSYGEER